MDPGSDGERRLLRHAVATLAYRGGKTLRGAPESFGAYRVAGATRTPVEVLAHLGDLLDWALALARGERAFHESRPQAWGAESARFFEALGRLDAFLASSEPLGHPAAQIFQGPIADALTHVGQIAMLRRLAGAPVKGENYFRADIAAGRVGPEQAAPRFEFD